MARSHAILIGLCSLFCIAGAFDLKGKIQWNDACPGVQDLGSTKVILDDGKWSGSVVRNGNFVIPDVPEGVYILSVLAHDHSFDQLRVDIFDSNDLVEVRPYIPGTPLNPPSSVTLPYPITLFPRKRHEYFVPPESFNVLAMFQNPMMLLMVFAGVGVVAMPYLMKNMDPEMMEDFKARQTKMASLQSAMQTGDIKSGISALIAGDDESTKTVPSSGPKTQNKTRGNKNKKK